MSDAKRAEVDACDLVAQIGAADSDSDRVRIVLRYAAEERAAGAREAYRDVALLRCLGAEGWDAETIEMVADYCDQSVRQLSDRLASPAEPKADDDPPMVGPDETWRCESCGPEPKLDEDGCCYHCGAEATVEPKDAADLDAKLRQGDTLRDEVRKMLEPPPAARAGTGPEAGMRVAWMDDQGRPHAGTVSSSPFSPHHPDCIRVEPDSCPEASWYVETERLAPEPACTKPPEPEGGECDECEGAGVVGELEHFTGDGGVEEVVCHGCHGSGKRAT